MLSRPKMPPPDEARESWPYAAAGRRTGLQHEMESKSSSPSASPSSTRPGKRPTRTRPEIADKWQNAEPRDRGRQPRTTLENSRGHVPGPKRQVLKKHDANAITINCLGGFYGGHIHAYPCLGFHRAPQRGPGSAPANATSGSTATMVALTTHDAGRPGYISDPVMDTSKRQIIYAHCVASNKAFGPQGRSQSASRS